METNLQLHNRLSCSNDRHNQESRPLVSVVMIFKDEEEFLREAIESVINQYYNNWELLLVDDGSTDYSTRIAKEYTEQYPTKIYYLEHDGHQNKGLSTTRNLGISRSVGEFIAFLDGDDVWLPQNLERKVEILLSRPDVAMTYGPGRYWFSWNGNPDHDKSDTLQETGILTNTLIKPLSLLRHMLKDEGTSPFTCSILVRRNVIERIGGLEESFTGLYEDQVLFAKISIESPIYLSSESWDLYRRHDKSICTTEVKKGQYGLSRLRFLEWIEKYLLKKRIKNVHLWLVLKKQLMPYRHPVLNRMLTRKGISSYVRMLIPRPLKQLMKRVLKIARSLKARMMMSIGLNSLSSFWGFDRGFPVHRYYLEKFLNEFSSDIKGHCLEFQEDLYATRFGGSSVSRVDILHIDDSNPRANIVADLTRPNHIHNDLYDCVISTHVFHLIPEPDKALTEIYRIIKPEGILLVGLPFLNMCDPHEYLRFSPEGLKIFLSKVFGPENVIVRSYGNSLTAAGDLRGLVTHEFTKTELEFSDAQFPLEVCARAIKVL